jgi:hypothetical protein
LTDCGRSSKARAAIFEKSRMPWMVRFETPPGAPDRVDVLLHIRVILRVDLVGQHVGVTEHDVQRCADLMTHIGEKLGLDPRRLQRIVTRVFQFSLRVFDAGRHLVDAFRETDELVAAFHGASSREVALRDAANCPRDLLNFLDHRPFEHRGIARRPGRPPPRLPTGGAIPSPRRLPARSAACLKRRHPSQLRESDQAFTKWGKGLSELRKRIRSLGLYAATDRQVRPGVYQWPSANPLG